MRPGTINRMSPIATPMPNRIPKAISGTIAGAAEEKRSPTVWSRLPSRTSSTSLTTNPV